MILPVAANDTNASDHRQTIVEMWLDADSAIIPKTSNILSFASTQEHP